ncbi:MAG: serine/threonine protein kinase [Proteobacteria bacterium]|nr:serine/threonine protein kinase [Pseudomonadota bacterium]
MEETILEAGHEFGGYRIEGLVAGGGMGRVYAARHAVYGTPVALKVLHADLGNEEAWRKRFSEEGLIGLQLKHPHIASARELVEQDGRLALVLDLVSGGMTLHRLVSRGHQQGLPLDQALAVLLGIVQGVEYAHAKGVVHGDLKPENVLIEGEALDPSAWVPRVTDFGTVALMAHPVVIDGQSAVVVSPRYASPEHVRGLDAIETCSDIYCLGLLLHYLVTGRHASTAATVKDAFGVVTRPLPVVTLVDLPDAVIALFQRCTMLDPEDRYQDCREVALAIRDVLDGLGLGLDLEDLQADLATEVIEDRQEMKDEAARQRMLASIDPFDQDEDLEDDLTLGPDEAEEEEPEATPATPSEPEEAEEPEPAVAGDENAESAPEPVEATAKAAEPAPLPEGQSFTEADPTKKAVVLGVGALVVLVIALAIVAAVLWT